MAYIGLCLFRPQKLESKEAKRTSSGDREYTIFV